MKQPNTLLKFTLNGREISRQVDPGTLLLDLLREMGCLSVKFSDEHGIGGADTVLLDGRTISAVTHLALQIAGREVETLEGLGGTPEVAKLAETFLSEGAVQCGYCTPAMLLALEALRRREPSPTQELVVDALSGIFCRCTGYVKPIRAALVAAGKERPRGENSGRATYLTVGAADGAETDSCAESGDNYGETGDPIPGRVVGRDTLRVDGRALAGGAPVFAGDHLRPDSLHLKILLSPLPHARILGIDITRARELPGVIDVVTWQDVPRRPYTTAGQGFPEPSPYDTFILDNKVRHVGDKVALVVAVSPDIAAEACTLIAVDYQELPFFTEANRALESGAPVIHDEERPHDPQADILFWPADPQGNIAARTELDIGDFASALAGADHRFQRSYTTHQVQQCHLEPHICIAVPEPDGRLHIISATQVPFHVRRVVARVLDIPVSGVRVTKPRIGGGFGGKQEILGEELCAFMALRCGRPVRLELTREEEFIFARSRHPQELSITAGFDSDGRLEAMGLDILMNTGAYGAHALTVMSVSANKGLSLYPAPNIRHRGTAVYSNITPPGAYRGYGAPQAFWALEIFMDEVAGKLGIDPLELRLKNVVRIGDELKVGEKLGEGREGRPSRLYSGAVAECIEQGRRAIGWDISSRGCPPPGADANSPLRLGMGMSLTMQGSGIPGIDMAAAFIKMNEDGGFNLQVGATDLGTGSDTVLAQIAAEVLGVEVSDMVVTSADTDLTPFDTGAYASSTTYITGLAVEKAALLLRERILKQGATLLGVDPDRVRIADGRVTVIGDDADPGDGVGSGAGTAEDATTAAGEGLSYGEICSRSFYTDSQQQLMASASHVSDDSPPPFAAQFVEIEVDTDTGEIRVLNFVTAVDAGMVLNPPMAEGQVEGAVIQGLGFVLTEEMSWTETGQPRVRDFREHGFLQPADLPRQQVIFVQDHEPTGPFGAKAVAEICINGPAPAVANALFDACGVRLRNTPLRPEDVLAALQRLKG